MVGAALVAVAFVGFFAEVRRPPPTASGYSDPAGELGVSEDVRSYAELRRGPKEGERSLYLAEVATLRAQLPEVLQPFERQPGDRDEALTRRAMRRAFDGAPPVVPHPVDQRAVPNCNVCHEQGAKVGDLIAPAMSHAALSSCQQCHVEQSATSRALTASAERGSDVFAAARVAGSEFEPAEFGGQGARAWQGAPPVMPHSMWMRQRCDSCHGVSGHPGLRTSHPERQSCVQCHAPQAALNQDLRRLGSDLVGSP